MADTDLEPGAQSEPPLCSVEGLEKHYGGVHALKGVSLGFHAGQVLV